MSRLIEPPRFISEAKSFETYERDLKRWALLTPMEPEKQALMVVHFLDGDPSNIKDKIDEEIPDEKLHCQEGIKNFLKYLKKIYKKDSLADGFEKYISFEKFKRSPNTTMQDFIPEWNLSYKKLVNIECWLSDKVLAFKLLDAANLSNIERDLVLSGIDYDQDNLKEKMEQVLVNRESVMKQREREVSPAESGSGPSYEKKKEPTTPFRAHKSTRKWHVRETVAEKRTFNGNSEDQLRKIRELGHYTIKENRKKVISSNFQDGDTLEEKEEMQRCKELLEEDLVKEMYKERWELLLHCEERQLQTDIRHYDMADTKLKFDEVRKLFVLEVPGLEENRPSVMKGDKIFVFSHSDNREYEGFVHLIQKEKVLLGFSDKLTRVFVSGMKFDVRFTVNRLPLRNMHRAVVLSKTSGIMSTLFPNKVWLADNPTLPTIICYDRTIETNPEQFSAVTNIVGGTSGRCPYLVFGPPGTGKTVTMVEAIKQVAKISPNCHMLACAPSNSAADLLTERLVEHISKRDIIRLHGSSRVVASIPGSVKDVSNVREGKLFYPMLEQLVKYKVIVTTLVTAARLVSAQFPQDHFTHLFIDDSSSATEPESVIAIAGLISTNGQVVLTGDPKQLGPVIRSSLGVKHGLKVSLMERLMSMELYSREFDKRCITKLVKNFRSHKELLVISKTLYYDNELDACADERMTESCLQFPGLTYNARKKKIPLLFHGVIGQDLKEETSPSFFNVDEIVIVLDYIRQILEMRENKVLPNEIGVISPYRRQVQKIRDRLDTEGYQDVMVGSTEEFQGQERKVIIISTVRSSQEYITTDSQYKLGFLANPKRFNVAITRSKSLLIIVGNPHILSQDPDSRTLLDFSLSKGCYTGCNYNQESDEDLDSSETRSRKLLFDCQR